MIAKYGPLQLMEGEASAEPVAVFYNSTELYS